MFDLVYKRLGNVHIQVNNAGINRDGSFLEMTDDLWDIVIATILTATFICSQEYAFRFKGETGHIVNIGALTGLQGRKNGVNY